MRLLPEWAKRLTKRESEVAKALDEADPVRAVLRVSAERDRRERRRFWAVVAIGSVLAATCLFLAVWLRDIRTLQTTARCTTEASNKITDGQIEWQSALTDLQAQPLSERVNVDTNEDFLQKSGKAIAKQKAGKRQREAC